MQQVLSRGNAVSNASPETRSAFIWRTYSHVAMAILGFTAIESYLFSSGMAEQIAMTMLGFNWLLILGAFMLVGWGATRVAHTVESQGLQYAALAAYVVMQAIIFVPMLYIAQMTQPGVIESAAGVTLLGVGALTAVVFVTKKDFSFLRGILTWAYVLALVAIVAGVLFGFQLGTWFSVAMIGFAGAAVLYDTSTSCITTQKTGMSRLRCNYSRASQ